MLLKATNKLLMQCKELILKATTSISVETQTTTWSSPKFLLKGDVTHEGNYTQTGNYTLIGNAGITGGFNQSGGAGNVSGGWTIDGINYKGHRHNGVQTGGGNTGTVVA